MLQFYHMERKLKEYTTFIQKVSEKPDARLAEYHRVILAQFQHERLIHLIITLFFALFLLLMFIFTIILFAVSPNNIAGNLLMWSAGTVTFLLLVVTLFYVRHYYMLENGVQKLEEITKRLYKIE